MKRRLVSAALIFALLCVLPGMFWHPFGQIRVIPEESGRGGSRRIQTPRRWSRSVRDTLDQIKSIKSDISTVEDQIKDLRTDKSDLQTYINKLDQEVNTLASQIKTLQTQVRSSEAQISDKKDEIEASTGELAKAEEDMDEQYDL